MGVWAVQAVWQFLQENARLLRLWDILDILIVAFVIYKGVKLVRETRAVQLIKGLVILLVATQLSSWLQLNSLNYLLVNAMQVGLIALLVVFQPELRRALEKVGRSTIGRIFSTAEYDVEGVVREVCDAVSHMSAEKIGALIVFERKTKLGDIINSGTALNSDVSSQLLSNIFIPNTPLHDGAVIIRENKILAAACFLPLTQNNNLSKELGTRHRAAIGISENADCAVVVVSEETGKISLALNGSMTRNLTPETLAKALNKMLGDDQAIAPDAKEKILQWTVKKK